MEPSANPLVAAHNNQIAAVSRLTRRFASCENSLRLSRNNADSELPCDVPFMYHSLPSAEPMPERQSCALIDLLWRFCAHVLEMCHVGTKKKAAYNDRRVRLVK